MLIVYTSKHAQALGHDFEGRIQAPTHAGSLVYGHTPPAEQHFWSSGLGMTFFKCLYLHVIGTPRTTVICKSESGVKRTGNAESVAPTPVSIVSTAVRLAVRRRSDRFQVNGAWHYFR